MANSFIFAAVFEKSDYYNYMKTTSSLRKALPVVAILALSLGTSSCDNASSWAQWILPILSEILGTGNYENTLYYEGKAHMEAYAYNGTNNTFDRDSRQEGTTDCVVTFSYNDSICQVKVDHISVGGDQVKSLDFATYFDPLTFTISPNKDYLTGGTCTFNGKAGTALDAACFQGRVFNGKMQLSTIYFTIGGRLFTGTFEGAEVKQ